MTLTSWIPTSSTPSSPSPSTGGSPGAARRLSRTRSAVSQSLSALEAALERGLFDRVDRRLALTREGLLAATPFASRSNCSGGSRRPTRSSEQRAASPRGAHQHRENPHAGDPRLHLLGERQEGGQRKDGLRLDEARARTELREQVPQHPFARQRLIRRDAHQGGRNPPLDPLDDLADAGSARDMRRGRGRRGFRAQREVSARSCGPSRPRSRQLSVPCSLGARLARTAPPGYPRPLRSADDRTAGSRSRQRPGRSAGPGGAIGGRAAPSAV